jgi:hypothetical protein
VRLQGVTWKLVIMKVHLDAWYISTRPLWAPLYRMDEIYSNGWLYRYLINVLGGSLYSSI